MLTLTKTAGLSLLNEPPSKSDLRQNEVLCPSRPGPCSSVERILAHPCADMVEKWDMVEHGLDGASASANILYCPTVEFYSWEQTGLLVGLQKVV